MEKITPRQLNQIYPRATDHNIEKYIEYINWYASFYKIDTKERMCAFLAQVGHESGELKYVEEIASGKAYEGRKDLGNVFEGDGVKYKGRGLIQVTGRYNYEQITKDLYVDFINHSDWLTAPEYATWSAFWYWNKHNLNKYATSNPKDFETLTRRINGGINGLQDRLSIWNRAKNVLK